MAKMRIERVTAVPTLPTTPSTMFIVRSAEADLAEVYFSSNDGTELRHVISKSEINSMISSALTAYTNIQLTADIAARDALTQISNALVLVMDASDDATVESGPALYVYDFAGETYHKVAEYESMDFTLDWASLANKPTSTVEAIDAAVAAAHTHANMAQLDKIGEDVNGDLLYNGAPIEAHVAVSNW